MSCNNPIKIVRDNRVLFVPCNRCQGCALDRLSMISSRCNYENLHSSCGTFLTLTYEDSYVPLNPYVTQNLDLSDKSVRDALFNRGSKISHTAFTLRRHHLDTFIDSLKRHYRKLGIEFSFLACGEYGGKFNRPHYHLCLYGLDFKSCFSIYSKLWKYGVPFALPIKEGSSQYLCKYFYKQKENNAFCDKHYLERPFVTFSKGLGRNLYRDHFFEIADDGFIHFGQKRVKVPVYYKNKYFNRSTSLKSRESFIESYLMEQANESKRQNFADVDSFLDYHARISESVLTEKARSTGQPVPLTIEHRKFSRLYNETGDKNIKPSAEDALKE